VDTNIFWNKHAFGVNINMNIAPSLFFFAREEKIIGFGCFFFF